MQHLLQNLSPSAAEGATEAEAEIVFQHAASVPADALVAFAELYPEGALRNALSHLSDQMRRDFAARCPLVAVEVGISALAGDEVLRAVLLDRPEYLSLLPPDRFDAICDEAFARSILASDPRIALRYLAGRIPPAEVSAVALRLLGERDALTGCHVSAWSSFLLREGRPLPSLGGARLFTTGIGQVGQGFSRALTPEDTSLYEGGRPFGPMNCVLRGVRFELEWSHVEDAERVLRGVAHLEFAGTTQIDVAPLGAFVPEGRVSTWMYSRKARKYGYLSFPPTVTGGSNFAVVIRWGDADPERVLRGDVILRMTLLADLA